MAAAQKPKGRQPEPNSLTSLSRHVPLLLGVAALSLLDISCGKILGFQDDILAGGQSGASQGGENSEAGGAASAGRAPSAHAGKSGTSGSPGDAPSQGGSAAGAAGEAEVAGASITAGAGASSSATGGSGDQTGRAGGAGSGGGGGGGGSECHGHPGMVSAGTYCIDRAEVTRREYHLFSLDQVSPSTVDSCHWKTSFTAGSVGADDFDLPIDDVDWCDAKGYCEWAGKRLCGKIGGGGALVDDVIYTADPNTDEWYRVCSRGGTSKYPYGKTYDAARCNFSMNGVTAAGQYPGCTTPDGVVDLLGNSWEWENACDDSATSDLEHVKCAHRGGSTYSDPAVCTESVSQVRSFHAGDLGFRCCAD